MAVRLVDVAARVGVSVKTVSNVVHGYPFVAAETRSRVQQALTEMDYRPNVAARNLRRGRTGFIGLGLPELDIPYFAELAKLVISAAEKLDYTVLIAQTGGRLERERAVLDGTAIQMMDGAILIPLAIQAEDVQPRPSAIPVVLLAEHLPDAPLDRVDIDNAGAAAAATEHLIGLGRSRIAAIGAQPWKATGTAALRLEGYRRALSAAGLPLLPELVLPAREYHRDEGAAAITGLLCRDDPPDAVFCFNDLMAIGALRAASEHGVLVPQELAIVGFDDIEEGAYTRPGLTTVAPDKAAIAGAAVGLVARRAEQTDVLAPSHVRIPWQLKVRGSSTTERR